MRFNVLASVFGSIHVVQKAVSSSSVPRRTLKEKTAIKIPLCENLAFRSTLKSTVTKIMNEIVFIARLFIYNKYVMRLIIGLFVTRQYVFNSHLSPFFTNKH